MSIKLLVLALLGAAALLHAEEYALGPDSQVRAGVPHGVVTKHILKPGRFYPGTPHSYAVYVPAQYDAGKPTPFMILLDGSGFLSDKERAPVVFDNLIAKHELPPMIGIFVDPGVLPAISDHAQNRYERVFEYDSLSDRYSRFLLEELIPEVAKSYDLSKDPNDRALSGVSTGAVGAFMAAWNRPDQFHRVLSFIGTYVAMKGADTLPALIRKTEPKPIRIFLQDGKNDHIVPAEPYGTFYAGSWPINNEVMFQAFEYAGYDAKLVMGHEGHNMKQGAAILPDALRWLWRDYPNGIVVHEPAAMHQPGWDPRGKVYSTISADQPWEQIGETATEANALRAGPNSRRYVSQPARKRIVSIGPGGDEKVVARNVEANDLAITAENTIYFIDTAGKTIGYVDAKGKTRTVYTGGEIGRPSGLALSPDQAMLVVANAQGRYSWSFQIAQDGSLINGEPFYRLEMPQEDLSGESTSGVRGVTEDSTGQVYFATPLGIQVCEANGRLAEILNSPEHGGISDVAFGGKERNWLYVTEGGKLFRRRVKVMGANPGSPEKPPKPSL